MKCSINRNGKMIVSSENEIEEYAMRKWLDDNYIKLVTVDPKTLETHKLKIGNIAFITE